METLSYIIEMLVLLIRLISNLANRNKATDNFFILRTKMFKYLCTNKPLDVHKTYLIF